jgi:hypothetical protein
LQWRGVQYIPYATEEALQIGKPVDGGVVFREFCVGGIAKNPDEEALHMVSDVAPEVALALANEHRTVYVARPYFTESPKFPLHDTIWGSENNPFWLSGCRKIGKVKFVGRVLQTPYYALRIGVRPESVHPPSERDRFNSSRALVVTDAKTQFDWSLGRAPHVHAGQRLEITAGFCSSLGPKAPLIGRIIKPVA